MYSQALPSYIIFMRVLQLLSVGSFSGAKETTQTVSNSFGDTPQWFLDKAGTPLTTASDEQLRVLAKLSSEERFLRLLQPFLVPRVPGTLGNFQVQQFISSTLQNLGYAVELDKFEDSPPLPYERRNFTNIVATLEPNRPRRLVLACHFDSKIDPLGQFIGATDAAVPCAMLLDLASVLRDRADNQTTKQDLTIQLLFMDGEEAFGDWSATDSLYGSRHLATRLANERNRFAPYDNSLNELSSMDVFVLLDLIGTLDTNFKNLINETSNLYNQFCNVEERLTQLGLIKQWGRQTMCFQRNEVLEEVVDDDHGPFMEKGVKVVHLISYPFPSVWHTNEDNMENICYDTVDDVNKILRVFVCEYLSCRP